MLLTPPNILLHLDTYAEVPKKPWNPTLDSLNPVNSEVKMSQPAQPEEPEARVYGSKFDVWPYILFPAVKMTAKVRVSCVYNYLTWGIRQLTINYMAMLWDVPMLLQEKLEEIDQKSLSVQFLSSVPGKKLILAIDYMISSSIRGGWCLMPCIDQEVDIRDNLIQQVLSTSVTQPLPMMEDDLAEAILKSDGQKEDDADPPFSLWDSCFYRSWKADRPTVHPLANNWQHLLCIVMKFSLKWRKHHQLRSCIAFEKRYQRSSHFNQR